VYQGGYNANTNVPNLDNTPTITINKGFTWTVTADGLFFTEQVRVGDLIVANVNSPTALADWTTVQNNVDLADLTTVGIGNVNAGTGISVAYSSGTATVTNTDTNTSNTDTGTIAIGSLTGTVNHNFGTKNTIVQTIDSSGDTVYCDVSRANNSVTATISTAQTGAITILVQKIG
jgi:microcompartment protein CcmK/EutM